MSPFFRPVDVPFGQPGFGAWFPILFGVASVFILAVLAYVIYAIIRNRRTLRRAGHNPDTIQADLANRVMRSDLLSSSDRTTEQKLAELDRLPTAGAISSE